MQLACLVLDHAQARSGDEPMARNGAIMAMPMVSKVRERKKEKEGTRVAALWVQGRGAKQCGCR